MRLLQDFFRASLFLVASPILVKSICFALISSLTFSVEIFFLSLCFSCPARVYVKPSVSSCTELHVCAYITTEYRRVYIYIYIHIYIYIYVCVYVYICN